jgi:P-type Cu+ transporter
LETKTHGTRLERVKLKLIGASCSSCVSPVKRNLEKIRGIEWVGFNPVLDLIIVDYNPALIDTPEIMSAIERAGFKPVPNSLKAPGPGSESPRMNPVSRSGTSP